MPVTYEKRNHVGILTLSRPEARNAWGQDFYEAFVTYFAEMEEDDDVHCAVVTGDEKGGAFSAGANLKDPKTHSIDSTAAFIKHRLPARQVGYTEAVAAGMPNEVIIRQGGLEYRY